MLNFNKLLTYLDKFLALFNHKILFYGSDLSFAQSRPRGRHGKRNLPQQSWGN